MSATVETPLSQTPILDRIIRMPPRVPPRSDLIVMVVVWLCILGAFAASLLFGRPPLLRQWVLREVVPWIRWHGMGAAIALLVVSVIGSTLAMVAVHETGHVLGGLAVGFRFKSIRAGPIQLDRPFRLSFHGEPGLAFNGVSTVIPVSAERLIPRAMVMLWAGPAANVLSGFLVLALPFPKSFLPVLFIVMSIANGLSDLLPYRSKLGASDGMFLWALFRHPARAERWLAIMTLNEESRDGVLPESLPAAFIAKAIAVRDDSIDTVVAHAYAFSAAFHQHRNAEAAQMLETCLRYASHSPLVLYQALMSDAAVFQARRLGRADLAEQWLADIPGTTAHPRLRTRAEAAILEARGDVIGALGKLDDFEQAIVVLPGWQREYFLRLLRRWKSELSGV